MKTIYLSIALMLLTGISNNAGAQALNTGSYNTAIGLRGGGTSGLTIKHFTSSGTAIEGILGLWRNAFSITGLYEKHVNAGASGLNWYYGGGAHIAIQDNYPGPDRYYDRYYYRTSGFGAGLDGIVGIEYKINPIPFAISLDLKPFLEITSGGGVFGALDPGLGLKFTF